MPAPKPSVRSLPQTYKEIDAPFGQLSEDALKISTYAIKSDSPGDAVYTELENKIASWTEWRNDLTRQIKPMIERAEFDHEGIDEHEADRIIKEGQDLLGRANWCAANLDKCGQ